MYLGVTELVLVDLGTLPGGLDLCLFRLEQAADGTEMYVVGPAASRGVAEKAQGARCESLRRTKEARGETEKARGETERAGGRTVTVLRQTRSARGASGDHVGKAEKVGVETTQARD
jgi:hypothetical protein